MEVHKCLACKAYDDATNGVQNQEDFVLPVLYRNQRWRTFWSLAEKYNIKIEVPEEMYQFRQQDPTVVPVLVKIDRSTVLTKKMTDQMVREFLVLARVLDKKTPYIRRTRRAS